MKKKNNNFKKPNIFVYWFFKTASKIYTKLYFNRKVIRNEIKKAKGPYVIIANHESQMDFMNIAACTKRRTTFIISNSFYQSSSINPLLKACGLIPKQQFQTNVGDIKKMKAVIDNGYPLVIYPAGLMSENGVPTPIPPSTSKFLKWLDCDIYVAYTTGSYMTNPKWGKGKRKGTLTIDIYKFLSKEQTKDLSDQELLDLVNKELYFNEYELQEQQMIKYKNGNDIRGLENVLYWCPKCNNEFTMKNYSYDTMKCTNCGNEVYLDEYSFLNPKTKDDVCFKHVNVWYDKIYENVYKEIVGKENFGLCEDIEIEMLNYKKHCFEKVGQGKLYLSKEGFKIDSSISGEQKVIEVPIKMMPMAPFKPGKYLEIQDGLDIYRCIFTDGQKIMKWIMAIKIFFILNNKKD